MFDTKNNNYTSSCIFLGSSLDVQESQVHEFPKFKILKFLKFKNILKVNISSRISKDSRKDILIHNISKHFDFLEMFDTGDNNYT
jgi:hypothetical protein